MEEKIHKCPHDTALSVAQGVVTVSLMEENNSWRAFLRMHMKSHPWDKMLTHLYYSSTPLWCSSKHTDYWWMTHQMTITSTHCLSSLTGTLSPVSINKTILPLQIIKKKAGFEIHHCELVRSVPESRSDCAPKPHFCITSPNYCARLASADTGLCSKTMLLASWTTGLCYLEHTAIRRRCRCSQACPW